MEQTKEQSLCEEALGLYESCQRFVALGRHCHCTSGGAPSIPLSLSDIFHVISSSLLGYVEASAEARGV